MAAALLLTAPALAQEARPAAPDLGALRAAAKKTRARLKTHAATWRVVLEPDSKAAPRIAIDVLATPAAERRIVYLLEPKGDLREALRLVIQPDAWYATEVGGARGIYRPRQVPFAFSRAYAVLAAADLRLLGEGSPGTFVGLRKGRAVYRAPLPAARRARIAARIETLQRLLRAVPKKAKEIEPRLRAAQRALEAGQTVEVDPATGVLMAHGAPGARVRVARFTWRERFSLTAFSIEDGKGALPDRRTFAAKDQALLAHCGQWRKGKRADELDARLLDTQTGLLRRVPYAGAIALPGCLLPASHAAVVCGDHPRGIGLFRVDLKTGANLRLGGAPLREGVCFSPAVSPDGKRLAALHMPDPRRPRARVYLLDLEGGAAKPLGKTIPATCVGWLPDGHGLLLDRRVEILPGKPATSSLVRLDLARGTLRVLRSGASPRVALGGKAILFRDGGAWRLCDLDGGHPRKLGDGLPRLSEPAVSPDGRRALMLRADPSGPRPVFVDLSTGAVAAAPLEPDLAKGLWGFPAW